MSLLELFGDNLLPVFLAAGAGYLLAARTRADPRPLAHVGFFVLAPCLVYQVIVTSRLPAGDLIRMAAFTVLVLGIPAAVAASVARLLRWPRTLSAALVLVVLLPNAGNFGLSANLLAFGDPGLAQASVFFVVASILTYTIGVLVASLGRVGVRSAVLGLLRVPTVWAVVAAFGMLGLERALPYPVERTVDLLAGACIPIFLVILGMQLRQAGWRGKTRPIVMASGLRLVGGAAVALAAVPLLGLEGPARQAGILQAAMPSAVITIILASEYEVEPAFVTAVVFITTILSPLTLTPLLLLLGAS